MNHIRLRMGTVLWVRSLVPSFQIDSAAISDYRLKIDGSKVHTFAKADLSGQLSASCEEAIDRHVQSGNKPDWYEVILETIVADGISLEINWKNNTTVEARATAKRNAEQSLVKLREAARNDISQSSASLTLTSENSEKTVLSAEGPVIVGYKAGGLYVGGVE